MQEAIVRIAGIYNEGHDWWQVQAGSVLKTGKDGRPLMKLEHENT